MVGGGRAGGRGAAGGRAGGSGRCRELQISWDCFRPSYGDGFNVKFSKEIRVLKIDLCKKWSGGWESDRMMSTLCCCPWDKVPSCSGSRLLKLS